MWSLSCPRASVRRHVVLAAAVCCASACTTTTAAADPAATPARGTVDAHEEVVVLRDRVARLERRLADVDARLALLLAARVQTTPSSSTPPFMPAAERTSRSAPTRGASTTEPLPEGLRAIDLPPRTRSDVDDDAAGPSVDIERAGPPIIDETPSGDDGSVLIQVTGDEPGRVVASPGPGARMPSSYASSSSASSSVSPGVSASTEAASSSDDAKAVYAAAQQLVQDKRYVEAATTFEDLLERFAADDLADNAAYWVAYCHQARGEHRLAIETWQRLPVRFPRSPKVPDALYGMAVSHEALGEPALAEALYAELLSSWPKAEKRKEARAALARMRPTH